VDSAGNISKHEYDQETGNDILSQINTAIGKREFPLYVAEGTAAKKEAHITRDVYLKMCFDKFSDNHRIDATETMPLAIFGHSLNKSTDKHLIEAIRKSDISKIYYGVHRVAHAEALRRLGECFPGKEVFTFDSDELFQ
jgi:hypothetical protein